jgi:predicted permease
VATSQPSIELGTGFVPGDDRRAGAAHTVLGYAYWQGAMGGSPDVLGRRIEVNGRTYTVVGVAPERFYGAGGGDDPVALWLPAADHSLLFPGEESILTSDQRAFASVARLAEGATIASAEAVAQAAWRELGGSAVDVGPEDRRRIEVTPYRGLGSAGVEGAFAFVSAIGGLIGSIVLLIACANVSGLLLGRALGRRREIGIRLAIGAGRRRIVRQLVTESVLLAVAAGAAGALLTFSALDALERTLFTFPLDLAPGFATLVLTLGVTGATGVAFGLVPALHATRTSLFAAIKDEVAGIGRRSSRLRDAFTVAQLALSLPLLTAAGLLVGQLAMAAGAEYGLDEPQSLVAVRIDLDRAGYTADEVGALLSGMQQRIAAFPGVSGAALTSAAPFWGYGGSIRIARLPFSSEDRGSAAASNRIGFAVVDPEYFDVMGIPILRGRRIERADVPGAPLAAVVDEDVARRWWPSEEPLGRTLIVIARDGEATTLTVVGVAGRVRMYASDPTTETPVIYAARRQLPDTASMTLVVRAADDPGLLAPRLRAEVGAVDSDLPVNVAVLADRMRLGRTALAHGSAGATAIGLIALLLACVGLYGMIATGVSERTREIGVRIALGADRACVVGHFVRKGLVLTVVALGVGLPLSWITVALVGARVVGVSGFAPEVAVGLSGVTLLMLFVSILSSWLPARRTSSVDPVLALRPG